MLKKITLTTLFVVSAAVAATGTVFAHSAPKAPVPTAPHGFCLPVAMSCCRLGYGYMKGVGRPRPQILRRSIRETTSQIERSS